MHANMEPRIYVYKITFEEVPHWYWGVHKEELYNEEYWGTPVTNRRYWEWYTPKKQILQVFDWTEEGWKQANLLEDRLIRPDLNKSLCLNEGIGGYVSLRVLRENNQIIHKEKNHEGKSINAVNAGRLAAKKVFAKKNKEGKSEHAVRRGHLGGTATHAQKDENGKSLHNKKLNERIHAKKTPDGKSVLSQRIALQMHGIKNEEGKSIAAINLAKASHREKNEEGKSKLAVANGRKALQTLTERDPEFRRKIGLQRWMDPNHPELGFHNAGVLARLQKAHGYPSEKGTRVKVKNED
jgi:hypothetical protein